MGYLLWPAGGYTKISPEASARNYRPLTMETATTMIEIEQNDQFLVDKLRRTSLLFRLAVGFGKQPQIDEKVKPLTSKRLLDWRDDRSEEK
jgi:hypothetical protein